MVSTYVERQELALCELQLKVELERQATGGAGAAYRDGRKGVAWVAIDYRWEPYKGEERQGACDGRDRSWGADRHLH